MRTTQTRKAGGKDPYLEWDLDPQSKFLSGRVKEVLLNNKNRKQGCIAAAQSISAFMLMGLQRATLVSIVTLIVTKPHNVSYMHGVKQ
jgi:hypothetical protein